MAITINLTNITVDLTAGTATVVDGSTYTSPTRTGCGVFVKVYKTDYSGARVLVTTTPNNTDPASASLTQWSIPYTQDGWYQLAYVAAPTYAGGTTYAKYDAVYDAATKSVYRSKSAGNIGNAVSNTTFWELISDASSLAFNIGTSTESLNLTTLTSATVYNIVLYSLTAKAFGTQTGKAMLEPSSDYRRSQDVRLYELLSLAVKACIVANNRQNYSVGEIAARKSTYLIALGS